MKKILTDKGMAYTLKLFLILQRMGEMIAIDIVECTQLGLRGLNGIEKVANQKQMGEEGRQKENNEILRSATRLSVLNCFAVSASVLKRCLMRGHRRQRCPVLFVHGWDLGFKGRISC